jgi:predicted CopG family antitoxin
VASKTVALDTEADELLKRQKRAGESFSDAVKRPARPRRTIASFGGMWSHMTASERKAIDRTYTDLRDADRRRSEKIRTSWK